MNDDSTSTVGLIVLRGLEGNSPTTLNAMQEFLLPYLTLLQRAWWILWIATLIYVTVNGVIVPILADRKRKSLGATE